MKVYRETDNCLQKEFFLMNTTSSKKVAPYNKKISLLKKFWLEAWSLVFYRVSFSLKIGNSKTI